MLLQTDTKLLDFSIVLADMLVMRTRTMSLVPRFPVAEIEGTDGKMVRYEAGWKGTYDSIEHDLADLADKTMEVCRRVAPELSARLGANLRSAAQKYEALGAAIYARAATSAMRRSFITAIRATSSTLIEIRDRTADQAARRVFIVHGHDVRAQREVIRVVRAARLIPVVLGEQPASGRTLIEKLELYSGVAYAIVLFTPDDMGGPRDSPIGLLSRARQNVILELGFFIGRLGRHRVCCIKKEGVEVPSDWAGVETIKMDKEGHWRSCVLRELQAAELPVAPCA